jgi:prevent-host-death family protein
MQHMSARDAKNGFGLLIDLARAEPVAIEKYGRPVVIVMAVEEYERLTAPMEPTIVSGSVPKRRAKKKDKEL